MEIIVTHVSSDFDSFAGMVAASKIHPDAKIVLPTSINQNVRKFLTLYEDSLPAFQESADLDLNSIKKIIMIDTKIPGRLGPVKELIEAKKVEIIIYDHHRKSSGDICYGSDYSEEIGATTSILVDIIKKKKIAITPLEATLFALGIYEDTGSFTYPATSQKDFIVLSYLLKNGADLFVISKFLNLSLSDEQHKLLEKLISNCRKLKINEKEVIISYAQTEKFIEGLSVLTRKLAQVEDIAVVVCWVKMKEKTYIVARSDDIDVDVSKILAAVGGGGHPQASSGIIKDLSFSEIENKIIYSMQKYIKQAVTAKDIMSYPVRVINEEESIYRVNEILKKYGHSGIPIVDAAGNLVGIITRKDIDKAIKHGLSHAPVKGFRSHGIITAGINTTIDEIQGLMIENGIGRIPIINKGKIVGIVTRKDILRHLHGLAFLKYPFRQQNYERLFNLFPKDIQSIFEAISNTARELKCKTYLVGGMVRDLLLGKQNFDIDIVVEGDGIIFAMKLSEELDARIDSYEKFKTAVIILENGQHIDVASARTEYYEKPAALPDVEMGSIKQDMARRDFTINTLVLSLNKNDFGSILDFFGGRKDIAAKRIKVLHKLSFIEDPTRIFRAVRFEQRLGFKMDSQTEKLAISAIEMNIVSELIGIRIRDELISILGEQKPWKALKRLHELGALKKIGIKRDVTQEFIQYIEKVLKKCQAFEVITGKRIEKWRLIISAMLVGCSINSVKQWCREMKIKNKDLSVIIESVKNYESTRKNLSVRIADNSKLYKLIHNLPYELVVIIASENRIQNNNIERFLIKLSDIRLEITGENLKNLGYKPSKEFKIVLGKLLDLKLDGKLKTSEDELAMANKMLISSESI
jgi:tRNA nucleotidyltransferase (CCA-adding enzyme)